MESKRRKKKVEGSFTKILLLWNKQNDETK